MLNRRSKIKKKRRIALVDRTSVSCLLFFATMSGVGVSHIIHSGHPPKTHLADLSPGSEDAVTTNESVLSTDPWNYFSPSWKKSSPWGMLPTRMDSIDSSLESPSKSESIVDDPQGKIEREFKTSAPLRERVKFWIDIYSRYSSRTRVVHDRDNPGIIYGHMDFRPLYRSMGSTTLANIRASEFEKRILKELRAKLLEASGKSNTNGLSTEDKSALHTLLSRAGALNANGFAQLLSNMRTQSGQSDMFLSALYRSKYLLPHIESVFKQNGLPVALGRIPFVESSFNARALSKIGAVGIWQFTPETARELIHADEEKLWADPLRQTKSAARMLRLYRNVLPDWGMTITSYNSGVGRVRRLAEKYKIKNVEDLVNLSQSDSLGFAGQNFYAEFLAANLVEAYKEDLFGQLLNGVDSSLVFKDNGMLPKEACDL